MVQVGTQFKCIVLCNWLTDDDSPAGTIHTHYNNQNGLISAEFGFQSILHRLLFNRLKDGFKKWLHFLVKSSSLVSSPGFKIILLSNCYEGFFLQNCYIGDLITFLQDLIMNNEWSMYWSMCTYLTTCMIFHIGGSWMDQIWI